ncbi:MAG: glycosyltransferase family 4 protein [Prevotella sp.]|nr:glycosyltransferase family 4 protein [Prevotella sp.]
MINILWFSLSPCGALRRAGVHRVIQGWMISLEDIIKKESDIKLSVAYFSSMREKDFEFDGVHYYPMFENSNKTGVQRVLERWKSEKARDERLMPAMLDVVRNSKPDIIHIHGTEQRFGLIADYVKDIPVVYSIQGLFSPICEKFFSGLAKQDIASTESFFLKIRGASINKIYKQCLYKAQREQHYLTNARYVFGRTSWDKNICKLFNPDVKYFIVNEIIRLPFFQHEWKKTKNNKTFIIVSTLSPGQPYKGFETLLKSAHLLKTYFKYNFTWKVVGYTENTQWVNIAEHVTGIKSMDVNIEFEGLLDADALAVLLAQSNVYCHVSHIENSPNSVCEAMCIGIPIVASFAGGTSTMLDKYGVMVQDGDPFVLAGALADVLTNTDDYIEKCQEGRKKALIRHSPENVKEELLHAYWDILQH